MDDVIRVDVCHSFSNLCHDAEYSHKLIQNIQRIGILQSLHQQYAIYANINTEIVLTKLHIDSVIARVIKPSFIVNIYKVWMGQQVVDRGSLIFDVLICNRV